MLLSLLLLFLFFLGIDIKKSDIIIINVITITCTTIVKIIVTFMIICAFRSICLYCATD